MRARRPCALRAAVTLATCDRSSRSQTPPSCCVAPLLRVARSQGAPRLLSRHSRGSRPPRLRTWTATQPRLPLRQLQADALTRRVPMSLSPMPPTRGSTAGSKGTSTTTRFCCFELGVVVQQDFACAARAELRKLATDSRIRVPARTHAPGLREPPAPVPLLYRDCCLLNPLAGRDGAGPAPRSKT